MNCYLCQNNHIKLIRNRLRHDIKRNVLQCQNCGLVFLEPKKSDLSDFYAKDYRKLYTPVLGKELESKELFTMYLPYQAKRLKELNDILRKDMSVLEIGCSSGHFLYAMRQAGYAKECIGIEFNQKDAQFCNDRLGIKVYQKPIEQTDIPKNHFDLIVMYHTLEHIEDPIGFLKNVSAYLKDSGHLAIEVPNVRDALLSMYQIKEYADFWFREPHIYNFSPQTLSLVLEKAGFKGEVRSIQEYNFLNHLNWLLTAKPQKNLNLGAAEPKLILSENTPALIREDINQWFSKVNQEYINLLNKHQLGGNILFVGKKK